MSDLTKTNCDQGASPSTRIGPANRGGRDRSLRLSDLAVTIFLLVVGCVRAPGPVTAPAAVPRPELWVDAFSPAGGDGTSARPWKTVPRPLPPGATVHLRTGLYAGPFVLGEGGRLEGHGEVVLTGEAGQTVVTAAGASLEGLSIQGGAIGLEAGPGVVVSRAHFSGQRRTAAVVHGQLTLSQARLEASVEGIDGVQVERGAQLELSDSKFLGGFRRAVLTEGGKLDLRAVSGEGPKTLVHAVEATSRLENVESRLGSGPALFFAAGTVTVSGAKVSGHEYSVQLARGVDARLTELTAKGGLQGCVSATGARLSLTRATLTGCGPGGAVSLLDSRTVLSEVKIDGAQELGVFLRKGSLELKGKLEISKITGDASDALGDAIHVRDAKLTGAGEVELADLQGSAVYASAFAQVELSRVSVERARKSALFVERGSKVKLGALLVRGGDGAAVVVPDEATVELDSLSVSGGSELPIYAECREGASVTVLRLEATVQQLPSRCVVTPPTQ